MKELEQIISAARDALAATASVADLEQVKARFLGRSGSLTELLKGLGKLSAEERPKAGAAINQAKAQVEGLVQARLDAILASELDAKLAGESVDVTLPGRGQGPGGLHPIARAQEHVEALFRTMGFLVADGPEIEDDFHNFTALRMFPDHPSRSMQDTFYIADSDKVLRTQTSPVQIRYMESHPPPVRIISPGRVYRRDNFDATHTPMFTQVEGLVVDENVSLGDLKGTLNSFAERFFDASVKTRFRPSFFPYTEPSAELDVECQGCHGRGCGLCKQTGWLEILGCGMVHPAVFEAVGYDAGKYTGFAFGMGIERLALRLYGIDDIRMFFENDLRFLEQLAP